MISPSLSLSRNHAMVHQSLLPFKVVKKRPALACKPTTRRSEELEDRVRQLEKECNRLRWFEFQYHHLSERDKLKDQRLTHLLHHYINEQTRTGEYSGIFY